MRRQMASDGGRQAMSDGGLLPAVSSGAAWRTAGERSDGMRGAGDRLRDEERAAVPSWSGGPLDTKARVGKCLKKDWSVHGKGGKVPKTVVRRIGGVRLRGRVVIRRLSCARTVVNPAVALVAARAALREASAAAAAHAVAADAKAVVVRRSACAAALTRSLPCAFLQVSTSITAACVATASSSRFDRARPTAALSAWIATAKFGCRCTFSAQKRA